MKIIDIYRYFYGYVVFEVEGGFHERFINLCAKQSVPIFNLSYEGKKIVASIKGRKFKKLKSIAKATGVTIRIREKTGLPFFMRKHKDRVGLLIGAVICLAFMVGMNQFVWTIETTGSQKYSDEEIISTVKEYGLDFGTFIPSFDEVMVAREIVNDFKGEILWIAINIRGSKAVVEVRDFVKASEEKEDSPCNILADFDGVILSCETIKGVGVAKTGSAVTKGDLLISGVVEHTDLSTTYCEAKGVVTALRSREFTLQYEKNQKRQKYKKTSSYYTLYFMSLKIPLGFYKTDNPHHTFYKEEYLSYNGIKLPFGIIKTTVAEYEDVEYTDKGMYIQAVSKFSDDTYKEHGNTNILHSKIEFSSEEDMIIIAGKYSCIDFIGKKSDILIENS